MYDNNVVSVGALYVLNIVHKSHDGLGNGERIGWKGEKGGREGGRGWWLHAWMVACMSRCQSNKNDTRHTVFILP